jgi:hypothetical protein
MKQIFTTLHLILLSLSTMATTITIKRACRIKDAYIANGSEVNANHGTSTALTLGMGTNGGSPQIARYLVRYDLSQIPANATIHSASVTIYTNVALYGGNTTTGGSNAAYVSRVTQDWNDNTVTWTSQPTISTASQATATATTSAGQDLTADVTAHVQYMINHPDQNYGMSFGLQDENTANVNRKRYSFSIEAADTTKWPELVIDYTAPAPSTSITNSITIQQASYIKDAYIADGPEVSTNHGNSIAVTAGVGTNGGTPQLSRFLVRFDLGQVPAQATISSAMLTIFTNTAINGGNNTSGGSNAGYVNRVSKDWNDNLITWSNQVPYSATSRASTVASTSAGQDVQTDVKDIIQYLVSHPDENYGMMFTLQDESTSSPTRKVNCSSVEATDSNKRPKLVINYLIPTGLNDISSSPHITCYPNPALQDCQVEIDAATTDALSAGIFDLSGRMTMPLSIQPKGSMQVARFSVSSLATGLYMIQVYHGGQLIGTRKLVVE